MTPELSPFVLVPIAFAAVVTVVLWRAGKSAPLECRWCDNLCAPGETLCDSCRKAHDSPPTNNPKP